VSEFEEIAFIIAADGTTCEIEASGFTGTDCQRATKPFEDALGITKSRTPKPEANRTAKVVKNVAKRTR
jgi:hypothetical protein